MALPTVDQLIVELYRYKTSGINVIRLELINRLELLEEKNVDDFTVFVCALLNNETIEKKLKKILYKISLVLGQTFPRNCLANGDVLDPLLLAPIDLKHLFISLDRYQWSIVGLVNYFFTKNTYQNPLTGVLFNQLDIEKMKLIARKTGLTVRLQSELTAQNSHGRRFDSRAMRHQLYSLFGFSFRTIPTSHNEQTVIGVPFVGGIAMSTRY